MKHGSHLTIHALQCISYLSPPNFVEIIIIAHNANAFNSLLWYCHRFIFHMEKTKTNERCWTSTMIRLVMTISVIDKSRWVQIERVPDGFSHCSFQYSIEYQFDHSILWPASTYNKMQNRIFIQRIMLASLKVNSRSEIKSFKGFRHYHLYARDFLLDWLLTKKLWWTPPWGC